MSPARTGRDATPPGSAPAVVRAVAVLDALAASEATYLSLSDISRAIGVPKSSTASICTALEMGGLLIRDDHGYSLGRRLVELGGVYLSRMDRVREFYAACAGSQTLAGETVRLWALGGVDAICLGRYEGHPPVRLTTNIGDRVPASTSAAGKVMLAQFDDHEVRDLYHSRTSLPRLTARSHAPIDALLDDLAVTRRRGYALDDEETAQDVVELAYVVPSRGMRSAVMAVSVTQHRSTYSSTAEARLVHALREVADSLGNPMQVI